MVGDELGAVHIFDLAQPGEAPAISLTLQR
jgi:hypothetical protein